MFTCPFRVGILDNNEEINIQTQIMSKNVVVLIVWWWVTEYLVGGG